VGCPRTEWEGMEESGKKWQGMEGSGKGQYLSLNTRNE